MSGVVMLGRIEVQVQLAPSISQDLSVALALHAGKTRTPLEGWLVVERFHGKIPDVWS